MARVAGEQLPGVCVEGERLMTIPSRCNQWSWVGVRAEGLRVSAWGSLGDLRGLGKGLGQMPTKSQLDSPHGMCAGHQRHQGNFSIMSSHVLQGRAAFLQ